MTFGSARPNLLALAVACAAGLGCGGSSELHGSPVLTQVYWAADTTQLLVWSLAPANLVSPAPPFASEVDFVFDRRLDGSRIEDIVTVNGITMTQPKTPGSIHATWPEMAAHMSTPPFDLVVDYNSVGRYGLDTAYVYGRPSTPGFPSDTTVSFQFDLSALTGPYGDPVSVPSSLVVKTSGFSVSIGVGAAAVVPSYQIPLAFTNRLPPVAGTSPFVHVTTVGGAAVPYKLLADGSLASRWYLAAADCLGAWPAGSTLTVTIDAEFLDAFGGALGTPAAATFSTSASTGTTPDASCSIPDAGTPDAAPDAGASEGGPSDAAASDDAAADADAGD